jgi:TolB-like protein/Flp pilus assembly protein TadD
LGNRAAKPAIYIAGAFLAVAVVLTGLNFHGLRDRLFGRPLAPQIRSLAVLPLENLSHDSEQEYFADGMTDELITELAKLDSVRVISRTSVMRFRNTDKSLPEIARSLNVDAVVEGSVQRVGDRVKVSARLLQARTDQELWAHSYERGLSDVLGLQHEVAEAIAGSIEGTLKPAQESRKLQTVDPIAHEAYLKGLYYWNKRTPEGLKRAAQYFQQAIDKDPNYAPAYAGLSYTYAFAPQLGLPSESARDKQKAAALKAVELDDSLPEAHTALAGALQNAWDWRGAELQYKRTIELNPNYATARHWYSIYLSVVGRHEEAIAEAKRALELDPLSLIIQANLGGRYLRSGRAREAILECQKALEMDRNFVVARRCIGLGYLQMGRASEAVVEFQTAAQLSGGDPESISGLGYALAVSGRAREATEIVSKLQTSSDGGYLPTYFIAIVDSGLGRKDEAFAWLNRAYRNRSSELPELKTEPMFLNLREDPRFQDLLLRIGLPL